MHRYRILVLAVATTLLATACGSSDGGASTIPTTTSPPTTTQTTTLATTTTTVTSTTTTATTLAPTLEADALIVANDDGAFLVEDEFLFQLVTGPVELALDDGVGRLVFQRSSDAFAGAEPDPEATIIDYLPPDSFEPQELLVPTGQQYLQLRDAADGMVWYTRREGDSPDTATETLRAYDMDTRAVDEFAVTGGWESGAIEVSVGGTNVAAFWSAEAATGFAFYSESGALVSFGGNPYEFEQFCGDGQLYDAASNQSVDEPCYEYAELSDDGRLAYYEVGFDGVQVRWVLVVVDLDSGTELFRQDLNRPDQGWKPATIDLGPERVLVNRAQSGVWGAPMTNAWLIDLDSGAIDEVGLSGEARFLNGPMAIS